MPLRDRSTMESGDNEDRISQLPDAILHHILSKVPDFRDNNTVHLVQTCILLSKRWSNLWASFPHLCFDDSGRPGNSGRARARNLQFARIFNEVLVLRDTWDVQSFRLVWINDTNEHLTYQPLTWMRYAIYRNVKDLTIKAVLTGKYFKLPSGIFTSSSLEELFLEITCPHYMAVGYMEIPRDVQLGRLRKLHLRRFTSDSISLKALMSGCPVLEDMELSYCMLQDPDIFSNSLKKLYIDFCWITGTRFRISVPSLQYLDLTNSDIDIDRPEVLLENLSSLAKASLQTDYHTGIDIEPLKYISPSNKCITGRKLSELQTFHNLKELHFEGSIIIDNLPLVACFLHRSPSLELMTLHEEVVIRLDPVLKKKQLKMDFGCPHLRDILVTFDEKTDEISGLLNDFCDDKCSCFVER